MKKVVLRLAALAFVISLAGSGLNLMAQDDRKKDSLSIDDMDPVLYEAQTEAADKGGSGMLIGAVIVVLVAGGGAYVLMSRKKKK